MLEQRCTPAAYVVDSASDFPDDDADDGLALDQFGYTTLRAAIEESNRSAGADVITFDEDMFLDGETQVVVIINLTTALPSITGGLEIFGPGSTLLTINRQAVAPFGIFRITSSGDVLIDAVSITNGDATEGGAIRNLGTLVVFDCQIHGNWAEFGGGIANIGTSASLSVTASSIYDNNAGGDDFAYGGGIYNGEGATIALTSASIYLNTAKRGGGVYNVGTLTASATDIYNNEATYRGGGVFTGATGASFTYSGGTIEYNSAGVKGGGIYVDGGTALFNQGTKVKFNFADKGGGAYIVSGSVTFTGCNILSNTANTEPGVCFIAAFPPVFNGGGNCQGFSADPNP